jgi:hypothetical protein
MYHHDTHKIWYENKALRQSHQQIGIQSTDITNR